MTTLTVPFTYSVSWKATDTPFEQRHYLNNKFFETHTNIHWVAVINSFALVILLTGFIGFIIRRVLKNDVARYNDDDADSKQNTPCFFYFFLFSLYKIILTCMQKKIIYFR